MSHSDRTVDNNDAVSPITLSALDAERLLLLDRAVQDSEDSVLITDADIDPPGPRIVFVNPGFTKMTGYSPEEVIGKSPRILQGPRTDRAVLDHLRQCLVDGVPFFGETINYRKDGSSYHLEWHISPVRSPQGRITHFVSVQRDITDRKRAEETLQQMKAQKARAAAILETQEEERRRMARELHDGLGQMLAAVKLNLEILEDDLKFPSEDDRRRFGDVKSMLATIMMETRRMSHDLMPSVLYDFGLSPALHILADQLASTSPVRVQVYVHGIPERLEPSLEVGLYRIVQEALSNIVKHAQATEATVQLIRDDGRIVLTIEDNGCGFDLPGLDEVHHAGGIGITNMRERAERMGGLFSIESHPGDGTEIVVTIPTEGP